MTSEAARRASKVFRERVRAKGLCYRCRKVKANGMCFPCKLKNSEKNKKYQEKLKRERPPFDIESFNRWTLV